MAKAKIFLVHQDRRLTQMNSAEYKTEDFLQAYLADYPDLLPGDQISPENPRRWLLVAREMGIPGEENGSNRWSLDHLFLDQDGILTLVECKRVSDTRTRREVVAQMLDYAANGLKYWSVKQVRQIAAETVKDDSLDDKLIDLLKLERGNDLTADIEAYWQKVDNNLKLGKLRLIFVADDIPVELRRLAEFLNEKMNDVEVLALELKQFRSAEDHAVLVPRLVVMPTPPPPSTPGKPTTPEEFFSRFGPHIGEFFQYVLDRAKARGYSISWQTLGFSLKTELARSGRSASFVQAYYRKWSDPNSVTPEFHFYFGSLNLPENEAQLLRERLLTFGVFEPSGEKTLKVVLKEGTDLNRVKEVYETILQEMDRIRVEHV